MMMGRKTPVSDALPPLDAEELLRRYVERSANVISHLEWVRRELTTLHTNTAMHSGTWFRKELAIIEQAVGRKLDEVKEPVSPETPIVL
jgi:hypothetical protein